jgi:hypothetical protein
MVQNVNPTFVKTPNAQVTQFSTGTGISQLFTTIYNGGANGSKIVGLIITANTSVTQDVRIAVTSPAGANGILTTISVSSFAGQASGVLPVNGFLNAPLPIDSDGNTYAILASSAWSLQAQLTTNSSQWATSNVIDFTVIAGDF